MEIIRLSKNDLSDVENFLAAQDFLPVHQSLEWGKFQEELGIKSFRVGIREKEELIAYVQGFVKKLPFGFSWLQIPRLQLSVNSRQSAEISDLILGEIQKIGRDNKTLFVRFEFQKDAKLQTANPEGTPSGLNLQTAKEENFPLATLVIDLMKSEEEIKASMKPKGRYNIRVAEKHEVEVEESSNVEEFFELLKKTTARDGFAGHAKNYYQKLLDALGGGAKLLVAKKEGKAIAGILLTFAGDTCTYYYGASDHEFRNLMAPYLLQWKGIQLAKERGCKFYDFLGIAPPESTNHHLAGVSSFKLKFGGEVVGYPEPKVLVLRPFLYSLFSFAKKLRG